MNQRLLAGILLSFMTIGLIAREIRILPKKEQSIHAKSALAKSDLSTPTKINIVLCSDTSVNPKVNYIINYIDGTQQTGTLPVNNVQSQYEKVYAAHIETTSNPVNNIKSIEFGIIWPPIPNSFPYTIDFSKVSQTYVVDEGDGTTSIGTLYTTLGNKFSTSFPTLYAYYIDQNYAATNGCASEGLPPQTKCELKSTCYLPATN